MPAKYYRLRLILISFCLLGFTSSLWSQSVNIEKITSLAPDEPVSSIQFIAGTNTVVYSLQSGAITLYNLDTEVKTSLQVGFPVAMFEISADGKHLAVAGKKNIAIYDLADQKQLMYKEDFGNPGILHFDPSNSNILIYTREPKKLMYHNMDSGDRMQITAVHPMVHFIYHTRGESLIVGTKKDTYAVNLNTGNTRVFYRQNQKGESNIERLGIWDDHCRPLAFTDSGAYLYTRPYGAFRRYLTVFDTYSGELEKNINVNYHVALEENLQALGIAESKDLILIPQSISEKPAQTGIKLTLFTLSQLKPLATAVTYSFKKKAKGNARVYYDLSESGKYIATYCHSCENPSLDIFTIK